MGLQSCRSLNFENFRTLNLGVPRQNDIWVQALWLGKENIIRGKVMPSPQVQTVVSLVSLCLFVHQKCSINALINLLFGLCMFV